MTKRKMKGKNLTAQKDGAPQRGDKAAIEWEKTLKSPMKKLPHLP